MLERPQVNIFALCERVVRDSAGKPSLLGIFDVLNAQAFPTAFQFFLFTQITAAQGEYAIAVHFNRGDDISTKIFEGSIRVEESPGVAHVVADLRLDFDRPGLGEFRLYINDEPRLTRPFHVRHRPE